MDERTQLLELYNKLAVKPDVDLRTVSNAHLLASILKRLDELQIEQHALGQTQLPDSMAFPGQTINLLDTARAQAEPFWAELTQFNNLLKKEFTRRRQIMITRLDCTVESFKWKSSGPDTSKSTDKDCDINKTIHDTYEASRLRLQPAPNVTLAHLLAARAPDADLWLNGVVSTNQVDFPKSNIVADVSESSSLKKVIIPAVPDRGGRPSEIRAPLRESFSGQRRQANNQRGNNRGRRR